MMLKTDFFKGATMRSTLRGFEVVMSASVLVLLLGCGGGGSSNNPSQNGTVNHPPVTTAPTWAPADTPLTQFTTYTFTTTGTDPDIGNTVVTYAWDFGDGTQVTTTVPTAQYAYTSAGTFVVQVKGTDNAGLAGANTAAPVTVAAGVNPFTLTATSPATASTQQVQMGNSLQVTFSILVVNAGSGTLSASGVHLDPNDTIATVGTPVDGGGGVWTIPVTYPAAAAAGSRTVTPTVQLQDSLNSRSTVVSFPSITIKTVSGVNDPPVITMAAVPSIAAGTNATWQGVPVAFTATATDPNGDALTYAWSFGDAGKGDIAGSPDAASLVQTHTFATGGVYPVVFTADDGRVGGKKSISLNLNILPNAPPALVVVQNPAGNPYANAAVTFTATVTDPNADTVKLTWDFGDATPVSNLNPATHSFTAAGITTVTLTADDGKGGIKTWSTTFTVQANRAPVAAVTTLAGNLFQKKAYTFTATASDPDATDTISQYLWDFGDGTPVVTSTSATQAHTYASTFTGNASVKVQAVDNHGAVGDFSPAAIFSVVSTSLPVGSFTNPAGAATYNTEVGAQGVSIAYIVAMTNPNGTGFLPLSALTFDPGEPAATATMTSSTANGDGTYTYLVQYKPAAAVGTRIVTPSITATDLQGIGGLPRTGGPVTINTQASNNPPVITFSSQAAPSAGPNASWQGVTFAFTGSATDADHDPMTYAVTFGDAGAAGDVPTTPVPPSGVITATHRYMTAGTYSAVLTVSDGRSLGTKAITLNMVVTANAAPAVAIATNPAGTSPYANVPVVFTATVTDANGDPTNLTWDFGDATQASNLNPVTHSFTAAGTTVVKATADDGKGGVTTQVLTLTVLANHAPVTSVTTPAATLYQNKAYTFTATAADPDAGDTITQYQWDLGDGTGTQTSATGSISHTFAASFTGTAQVKVRAVDNHGSTGDYSPAVSFTVVATPLPVVAFLSPGATSLNAELNGTVSQAFVVTASNPRAGASGVTDPIPATNLAFLTNDPLATILSTASNGGGTYTVTVRFSGAAAAGTRTTTPSLSVTDSVGIQSLSVNGPAMTIKTLGVNHAPVITITSPATDNTGAYTSKSFSLSLTLTDADNDPVVPTVDWGDGQVEAFLAPTGAFTAGVPVTYTHTYADAFTATSASATIKVNATDNRSANAAALVKQRIIIVTFNALPTAAITSPQASGTAPAGLQGGISAPYVVVPSGGKLSFAGTSTLPGSQDAVTTVWSFPNGTPSTWNGNTPGDVIFTGDSAIDPVTVTLTVTDPFGRVATATKQVLVDGKNLQHFNLSFQYRLKSDNNGNGSLVTATQVSSGLGAAVQIFQDGLTNTYNVQDLPQLAGAKAAVSIPVRSDLPFYVEIPTFGTDTNKYLMRIPNAPGSAFDDVDLTATAPAGSSSFYFANPAASPWDPTLKIVTAQGFAAESASAPQRKLNWYTDLVYGPTPVNQRWLDRLSVPLLAAAPVGDASLAIPWSEANTPTGQVSGTPAYQLFAEWPTLLVSRAAAELVETPVDPTTAAGAPSDLGFVINYPKYMVGTQLSETFTATSMQAFRVPAGVTDPYQLSPAWQNATAELGYNIHAGLNPVQIDDPLLPAFLEKTIHGNPGSTPLQGGIASLQLVYDPNDPDRIPLPLSVYPTNVRTFSNIIGIYSYSEYLWSSVWARPLVLNSARMNSSATSAGAIGNFKYFRYSKPAAWPKASNISPDASAFDLNATGGGTFTGVAPVAVAPATPSTTGVGHFYWTAYTPTYSGDANSGATIARTWLAAGATQQIPTTLAGNATRDATVALGFMTPQDTIVDKRGRNADGSLNGTTLGGYRVTWFNPTKDASGNPVPPDFWVVELADANGKKHFMLPSNYPRAAQSVSDMILTDARVFLPSGNLPTAGPAAVVAPATKTTDRVAPGYCWFDIPAELRPSGGATLRVFALKAMLRADQVPDASNAIGKPRPLNRPDWIDAIKTATATMTMISSDQIDSGLKAIYQIPFNFDWDIVVANGPKTPVAP
jgi:PKD repeat protein